MIYAFLPLLNFLELGFVKKLIFRKSNLKIKSSFFVISFIIKITTGRNERKIKFVYKLVKHMMAQAIKNGVIGTPKIIAGLVKAL